MAEESISGSVKIVSRKPIVAWHDGGLLFAGDETNYPPGWYMMDGESWFEVDGKSWYEVDVFVPFSNDELLPSDYDILPRVNT